MGAAEVAMVTLADNGIIFYNYSTQQRVGVHPANPFAGQQKSSLHVFFVKRCHKKNPVKLI
jgi:hypothetical protein